jgi:hypothetical protein
VLASIVLVLIAFSAVAARGHHAREASHPAVVETADYLAWHRQEAGTVELDTLGGSLRLFSTIADQLAADASGDGVTAIAVSGAPAVERAQQR